MTQFLIFSLYFNAVVYIAAGIFHFVKPKLYLYIMPPFLPAKTTLNYLSGLAEIVLGAGLLWQSTRLWASYGLIALLISFFAVHIGHLYYEPAAFSKVKYKKALLWGRILLQFVLILWVYAIGKLV